MRIKEKELKVKAEERESLRCPANCRGEDCGSACKSASISISLEKHCYSSLELLLQRRAYSVHRDAKTEIQETATP